MGSKLAFAAFGAAASLVLVAGGSAASGAGLGRIALVSEFHSTEVYLADGTGKNQRRLTNNPLGSRWPTLSPDGKRVAFSRKHAGGWSVYVMNVGGGPLFDVTAATGHRGGGLSGYADWSPDGNKIAFSQEFPDSVNILVYDFQFKSTLDVTHNKSANMRPRWSPQGEKIAYSSIAPDGSVDIYTVYADGTNETRLTTQNGWEIEPTWSPDGRRLAYTAYPAGKADVFVMNADGSGARDVTNDPEADDYQPSWSSAGIAFSSLRNGHQIYVVQPDGSGRRQLTSGGNGSLDPRWAQGGRIVFSSSRHARSEIGAVKGTAYRPLTRGPWLDADPAWSPDGRRLAFTRNVRPGQSDIYVADSNGKGQRNLTRGRGINWGAAWSPRTNMIAFVRFESFGAQIWSMRPDGTGARALTSAGSWNEHPSWSPDGRRLVYSARRNGTTDLYVLDLQTRRERRLTRTPEEELDPAWSPDNKWIAFTAPTHDSSFLSILVVRPDGTGRTKVTDGGNNKTKPTWAPDGKRILYEEEFFLGHDFDVAYVTLGGNRTSFVVSRFPWSEHSPAWQPRT